MFKTFIPTLVMSDRLTLLSIKSSANNHKNKLIFNSSCKNQTRVIENVYPTQTFMMRKTTHIP